MLKKLWFSLFIIMVFLVFSNSALASFNYTPMEAIPGFSTDGNFCNYIVAVYKFGIWVIGFCAMFMIMIGGYMYLLSGGNTASMGKAKGIIVDAIVGLLLAFSAYLIVYVINPDLVQIKGVCDVQTGGGGGNNGGGGGGSGSTEPIGSISPECDKYDADFKAAASSKEDQCRLKAIAMQESGCNPNIGGSSAGAYGLMQIKPATANMTPEELKDPKKSITKAAEILKEYKTKVNKYGSQFDIGDDDLIASYNAGTGNGTNPDGTKQPFALSGDCPSPPTPAWQCPKNPGGFKETQDYVNKVQNYQEQCMKKAT